ncbi:siderophore-interacting protein [Niveispirillum sp. SYP-B3756]|uniref:siderophore-interacting protein n=1 Tax=Niveispirillum sp. SYP-B3756 TaxID=2662178 RepID=UPI0012925FCB|nr:siderophore-interacting protein [Niveispirillum sp. SYP-B3756]MQP65372.1 siderophore-interacting protein [Niveispirillum sp. SYP-B3756]
MENANGDERTPRRVRHELRFRQLLVSAVTDLTPSMRRITLTGPALEGFDSPGFDDHVKLFFPRPGEQGPVRPVAPDAMAGEEKPIMRDFTPRHYDAATNQLTIDFALHESGPAADWARTAQPGDPLGIGGPRGSMLIPLAFDWHLLVGDETALPAVARRLEELPAGSRAIVVAAVAGPDHELPLTSAADLSLHWVHRPLSKGDDADPFLTALAGLDFPPGAWFGWIAAEASVSRAVRAWLETERAANPAWLKASGYWVK